MSKKVLWRDVRTTRAAWAHTQAKLVNDRDIVVCRVCSAEAELEDDERTKASLLREFTRKHFYKCVPNFAEQASVMVPKPGSLLGPRSLFGS